MLDISVQDKYHAQRSEKSETTMEMDWTNSEHERQQLDRTLHRLEAQKREQINRTTKENVVG